MTLLRDGPIRRIFDAYRVAILVGVASIPFTVGINMVFTTGRIEAIALFGACLIAGYLYESTSVSSVRAGAVSGLAGGVPVAIWQGVLTAIEWWGNPILEDLVGDGGSMALSTAGATMLTVVILTVVVLIVGTVGGLLGGWLGDRVGRRPTSEAGSSQERSS